MSWEGGGVEHSVTSHFSDRSPALGYVPRLPWQQHASRGQMATPQSSARTMTSGFLLGEALVPPAYSSH